MQKTKKDISSIENFQKMMSSIKKFENSKSKTDILCLICLNPITASLIRLNCKHKFHKKCIDAWNSKNPDLKRCAVCRRVEDIKNSQ